MSVRTTTFALTAFLCGSSPAFPCSAFMRPAEGGPIVAKSYDWSEERALVLINKRNVRKHALVMSLPPASWTSRYASVTFNQYGREFPDGGMNEEGLVVEVLMLPKTSYPAFDGRPAISELGLVQFLLDQASTLKEGVTLAREVRVVPVWAKLHYFVCDRTGACATLEFLSGELVVTQGEHMPVAAITNSTYADSRRSLDAKKRPKSRSSLDRFNVIHRGLKEPTKTNSVEQAWKLLNEVRFSRSTQWQLVYEVGERRVQFRTRTHPTVKKVSLRAFDGSCQSPVMMHDMLSDEKGDITAKFVPYDKERNRTLLRASMRPMKKELPMGITSVVAAYPDLLSCTE